MTGDQWNELVEVLRKAKGKLDVIFMDGAPETPVVIGSRLVCRPEYYRQLTFTIGLMKRHHLPATVLRSLGWMLDQRAP